MKEDDAISTFATKVADKWWAKCDCENVFRQDLEDVIANEMRAAGWMRLEYCCEKHETQEISRKLRECNVRTAGTVAT